MSRPIVPIRSMALRLPDVGRIRLGKKGAKGQPQAIDRFRFTSSDRAALVQVADLYGGTVVPWSDPKAAGGQFEVFTDATEIRIALPPDPLGNTPIYELWSGGGCQRRCDGETCELIVAGADGPDLQQTPCICVAKNVAECKVVTRLSVLLPEIRMTGVWRLDSKSWNVAQEMPGFVELIRSLQDRGITRGLLRLEDRVQVIAGKTNRFKVPVLGVDESVNELAAGMAQLGALGTATTPAGELTVGVSEGEDRAAVPGGPGSVGGVFASPAASPSDDDIVDAEVVDERTLADVLPDGVSTAEALAMARRFADEFGIAKPTALEQVTDYRLSAKVLVELGCVEAVG